MVIRQNRDNFTSRQKSEIFLLSRKTHWARKSQEEKRLRELYSDETLGKP